MLRNRFAWFARSIFVLQFAFGTAAQAQTETATAGLSSATEDKTQDAPADPTGTWQWEYSNNDNTIEFEVKLNWDGKKLNGKYTAFDETTDIENAKLEKDQLSFVTKREFNGNEIVATFNGSVKPDDIEGTVEVDFGNGSQEFDWHAQRAVETDDVLGVWELKIETPNGLIEPKLTLTKDGEKLKGAYESRFGAREPKDLTLKENTLTWEISGEREGVQFKVIYSGKPRGNAIEGTSEFDFDGNTGTLEFTGKRTPPEEKEKPAAEAKSSIEPVTEGTAAETENS
jgi:hypothetical protein